MTEKITAAPAISFYSLPVFVLDDAEVGLAEGEGVVL
jgi:hypothetical protein